VSGGLWLGFVVVLLGAIWPFGRNKDDDEQPATIQEVEARVVTVDTTATIDSSELKAMEGYRLFLELADGDPALQAEAMRRLADLQLEAGEVDVRALAEEGLSSGIDGTIDLYEQLILSHPDYEKSDLVLYQLARAYEARGDNAAALATLDRLVTEYPGTPHWTEAEFRRGETLFVEQRYDEAEAAYAAVLERGPDVAFAEQSLYKLGWSRFKQLDHEGGIDPFFELLDRKLASGNDDPADRFETLGRADQELVNDTLRVLAISFSYLDGAGSIGDYLDDHGNRPYAYVVFTGLGDLYIEQERFQDAADAYFAFVDREPAHSKAPLMQVEVIEAYKQGGFADLVLEAKRDFVERYAAGTEYWATRSFSEEPEVAAHLKSNITDLAAYHHAEAQRDGNRREYAEAARWYRTWLDSFPADAEAAGTNFLLAEVLFESGDFDEAAREYERTAYEYPVHESSGEAGYAALLAYDEHEEILTGLGSVVEAALWHRQGIDSALRFSRTYPGHERAPAVRTDAAEQLFALDEFAEARDVAAEALLTPMTPELERTAWTVVAHSEFDLGNFASAESAYLSLKGYLDPLDSERGAIDERIASSIYRQGEQAQAQGQVDEAVDHYLRVGRTVPDSPIRATAEYDAAAALIQAGQWERAAPVLENFRATFPDHELAANATASLAVAYAETGQDLRAAREFEQIARTGATPAVRQEALWSAGELYRSGGDSVATAAVLERYVAEYPEPFSQAIEARNQLADLALDRGDASARIRWLEDLVAADALAGAARTDRSLYLAAHAELELAEPARRSFEVSELVAPLEQSLTMKRERMEVALAAYTRAASYGVPEVTTAATYYLAEIYHDLSRDLFASERPPELSALELDQYEILLEEQAFPFEEEAIELHEVNAARTAEGIYDEWVAQSLTELAELNPGRYAKFEKGERLVTSIH
jgi:TolA-binding protein